eukprot:11043310-Lingulodinium_polyedra.AAC.1
MHPGEAPLCPLGVVEAKHSHPVGKAMAVDEAGPQPLGQQTHSKVANGLGSLGLQEDLLGNWGQRWVARPK